MKLVLKSFSQEVDLTDLSSASSFLVFQEEGSGEVLRIPVPQETIMALSEILAGDVEQEEQEEPAEQEEPEAPPAAPKPAVPATPGRKTLRRMQSEGEVPNL